MNMELLDRSWRILHGALSGARPAAGLILGSGWGAVTRSFDVRASVSFADIPALGEATVKGHAGRVLLARIEDVETLVFQGRRHWYEGMGWEPVAFPLYALRRAGAAGVVLTNAAGGIRHDLGVGSLMLVEDHINAMGVNPLVGPHDPAWGPRFPDMTEVYDAGARACFEEAARAEAIELARGVYAAVSGPSLETPAEIAAVRAMGADAIGMSTVPEAVLARAAGLRAAAVCCISNRAAGGGAGALSHDDITAAVEAAAPRMSALLRRAWPGLTQAWVAGK